jgi:hypothetical protein
MSPVVDVPLNTAIADLDEALRSLLRRELSRHGFEGVEISFDAPSKEWSGKLTAPTVDLFLYDLREATERSTNSPEQRTGNGGAFMVSPPLRLELTYAVTAWTKDVEDEHRLLSQALAILFSHSRLPDDVFDAEKAGVRGPADTSVGRPREEKADFWSAIGGQYKASIDYVVHISIESGARFERGPEVRARAVRLRKSDGPASTLEEFHGLGGTVTDAGGGALPYAWIVVPELGLWTASDLSGRFRLARVRPGKHRVVVRTIDGQEAETTVTVPGSGLDVVVGGSKAPARTKSR